MVKVCEVKALNGVEDDNWCGIIHNTFSEYKTVKQRCLILIQHLYHNTQEAQELLVHFVYEFVSTIINPNKTHYLQCAHRICCRKYGTNCWESKHQKEFK